MKKVILAFSILVISSSLLAQNDKEAVKATVMDYIDGTAQGNIDQIKRAFHDTAALFAVNNDGSLRRIPIAQYVTYFKPNQPTGRKGKIVSMDIVKDAANVKVEILSNGWKFTDYILLLKLNEGWKIINKSYTRVKAE